MTSRSLIAVMAVWVCTADSANVLMVTMAGTKSHKIPFLALGEGLKVGGHHVTLVSAFPPDKDVTTGLHSIEEIAPSGLVFYVRNFTDYDLLGSRLRGDMPVSPADVIRFAVQSCEVLLGDPETRQLLDSGRRFDLVIADGAFPECALGLAYHFRSPSMYINTVAMYTETLTLAGNPAPFSVTPFFGAAFTDRMGVLERAVNTAYHLACKLMHVAMVKLWLQAILRSHLGPGVPSIYAMQRNVSFILHNGHSSVTYPRAFLPNVAEVACIHCRPPRPLTPELDDFINGSGDDGFVYVSMGSSVRSSGMPEYLRLLLVQVFRELSHRVVWKWDVDDGDLMLDLPRNVRLSRWLPQQDLLGHKKIRAFVTHGGLLSMFESVYHGVPMVTMPVFCDHDANAIKADRDGYAIKLDLQHLTPDKLLWAIRKVIHDPRYRQNVRRRSLLLRDEPTSALKKAVFWTEYVLRHAGAPHLQSPASHLGVVEYFVVDVLVLYAVGVVVMVIAARRAYRLLAGSMSGSMAYVRLKTE